MSDFDFSSLCGWNEDKVAEAYAALPPELSRPFQLIGEGPTSRRMALFEVVRKVVGSDPENIAQQIGDCVSWGYKHAIEQLQCFQIAMGNMARFRLLFSPYHYGTGRVYEGGGRLWGDGSVGAWQIAAVQKHGVICLDDPDVPPYSGSVARQFGKNGGGVLEKFAPLGKQHLVKGGSLVKTWDQLVTAICNGYPVAVCSNQGFQMTPSSDGFHHPKGSWGHCMNICYVDDDGGGIDSHTGIMNSWGDVHGKITDFRDPSLQWPVGMLRVRKEVVERMLAQEDTYALSSFTDFPAQVLPIDFFRQW